jgi:hypothetical protein
MEALSRELAAQGVDVRELNELIGRMRNLEGQGTLGEPRGLAELQGSVIQGLKAFEFALRRQIQGTSAERLLLHGNEDVPDGFRKLVEEYYKSLSNRPPR